MKEIITLQFGPYANHVGAHWWNFQVCCRQLTTILVATGLPYTLLHGVCVQDELFSPVFSPSDVVAEFDASILYREGRTEKVHKVSLTSPAVDISPL